MKSILSFILIFSLSQSFAQVKIINKQTSNILTMTNTLKCSNYSMINLDNNDTSKIVELIFRNEKYSTLIDMKSILFDIAKDRMSLVEFKTDLTKILKDIDSEDEMIFTREKYSLYHSSGSSKIILGDIGKSASGVIALNANQSIKLINWINELLDKIE